MFVVFLAVCERDPSWAGLAVSSCDDCITLKLCGTCNQPITNTQCSLSVHIQQTLHWFYHTKHTDRNHYTIIINFIVKRQPMYNFRRWSHLFCATLYSSAVQPF